MSENQHNMQSNAKLISKIRNAEEYNSSMETLPAPKAQPISTPNRQVIISLSQPKEKLPPEVAKKLIPAAGEATKFLMAQHQQTTSAQTTAPQVTDSEKESANTHNAMNLKTNTNVNSKKKELAQPQLNFMSGRINNDTSQQKDNNLKTDKKKLHYKK